jgi:hypothetical protein
MNLQFTTSALLLAIAFLAISLVGFIAALDVITPTGESWPQYRQDWVWGGTMLCWAGPVFIPVVFIAYATGRRRLSPRIVAAFAFTEAIAICVVKLLVYFG